MLIWILVLEMNNLYGSFTKSMYTTFEITHSGSWPARVRPVIEKVSVWYAIPFLTYITLVVFAAIRIVHGLVYSRDSSKCCQRC